MRRLIWLALLLGLAAWSADFLYSVFLKYQGSNPESMGLFVDRKDWLFMHLAGGALTIALGLTPSPSLIATLLWASWVTPLLLHEAVVRLFRIGRAGSALSAPEPFA